MRKLILVALWPPRLSLAARPPPRSAAAGSGTDTVLLPTPPAPKLHTHPPLLSSPVWRVPTMVGPSTDPV